MIEESTGIATPTAWATLEPISFYTGQNSTMTITFISPHASLTNYNYTITSNYWNYNGSGSTPSGEVFNQTFYITPGTTPSNIIFTYNYNLDNGASGTIIQNYRITAPWSNKTLINIGEKDYGMLIGDKIFWLVLGLLILMGVVYLGAGIEASLVIGLVFLFLMNTTGYISSAYRPIFWVTTTAMIILLISKAWGGR